MITSPSMPTTEVKSAELFAEVKRLLSSMSLEVTPTSASKISDFSSILPAHTEVFVTHLPGTPFSQTIQTALQIAQQNMTPVVHIAARTLKNKEELQAGLDTLLDATKPCHFLLIGGGGTEQQGPFSSAMDILRTDCLNHRLKDGTRIYLAGHPEGTPDIADKDIETALREKNAFAQDHPRLFFGLVTQFCFTFEPIRGWLDSLQANGNTLPVIIGVPGAATIKSLYNHAKACGIGNSINFIAKQAQNITLLTRKQQPNRLIYEIARHNLTHRQTAIHGLHLYPFGGIIDSLLWHKTLVQNELITDDKEGFIPLT